MEKVELSLCVMKIPCRRCEYNARRAECQLGRFQKKIYKIIKKNILKKVVASQKIFYKIAHISFDFSKLTCARQLFVRRGGGDSSVATSRFESCI